MIRILFGAGLACSIVFASGRTSGGEAAKPVPLLNEQAADGSIAGWRFYCEDPSVKIAEVWKLGSDGVLVCKGKPQGYLYTEAAATDFDLSLEWRSAGKAGRGGVLVRTTVPHRIWPKSLEAQLNAGDEGDFWGLGGFELSGPADRLKTVEHAQLGKLTNLKRIAAPVKPSGQWNRYEISARQGTVTLKINGVEVNRATRCEVAPGVICLTAEGDPIEFRDIRLARLDGPEDASRGRGVVPLFNGRDLADWDYFLEDPKVKKEDVWSVRDGLLVCKGEPMGYLATKRDFRDFRLRVEWRWAPGKTPGNSGVFLRVSGKPKVLPKCVEVQLKHESAGDLWAFEGFGIRGPADRLRTLDDAKFGHLVGVARMRGAEKPAGEWNALELVAERDKLTVSINGQQVNEATGLDTAAGKIGLQSEGGEVHFRRADLVPLGDR